MAGRAEHLRTVLEIRLKQHLDLMTGREFDETPFEQGARYVLTTMCGEYCIQKLMPPHKSIIVEFDETTEELIKNYVNQEDIMPFLRVQRHVPANPAPGPYRIHTAKASLAVQTKFPSDDALTKLYSNHNLTMTTRLYNDVKIEVKGKNFDPLQRCEIKMRSDGSFFLRSCGRSFGIIINETRNSGAWDEVRRRINVGLFRPVTITTSVTRQRKKHHILIVSIYAVAKLRHIMSEKDGQEIRMEAESNNNVATFEGVTTKIELERITEYLRTTTNSESE